jgi:hypothetical protein
MLNLNSLRRVSVKRPSLTSLHTSNVSFDSIQTLDYKNVKEIKENRFGSQLGVFKRIYEEPLVEAYNTIHHIKSTYANRQARYMMRDGRRVQKAKKFNMNKFLFKGEKAVEYSMHSYLKRDLDRKEGGPLFRGKTRFQRIKRETFIRQMMTDEKFREYANDDADPLQNHLDTVPNHVKDFDISGKWETEVKFEKNQLAEIVAKEVEARGFKMTTNWSDRAHDEQERKWNNPYDNVVATLATQNTGYLAGDRVLNRPALLKPGRERKKFKTGFVRMHKVSGNLPIGFESTHYPLDADMYDPYNVRKCTFYCKLHSLRLPKIVRTRLLQIAGHFYNDKKDLFVLKYQKKRTYSENKRYVLGIMSALLREAWKADLNFIPSKPDLLQPHQIIEEEIKQKSLLESQNKLNAFDNITETSDFTLFQITSFPFIDSDIILKKEKVNQLIEKLAVVNSE